MQTSGMAAWAVPTGSNGSKLLQNALFDLRFSLLNLQILTPWDRPLILNHWIDPFFLPKESGYWTYLDLFGPLRSGAEF
jgi:hypothetical protein